MALESKSIMQGLIIAGILLLGVIMAVSVTTDTAGGLAAMVPLITVLLALLAWARPKAGLYGLAALVIWVDEFKRLAVYFGGAQTTTVIQILAMPFVVLAALNAGFLLNLMFQKVKIDKVGIMLYLLGAMIGFAIFFKMDATIAARGQRAGNIAGYFTLIPITYTYLKTFDDWRRFFSFQCLLALPAAAWAIKQYYFGFDSIEWVYAQSGLSRVHYSQMFGFLKPRTFGFFGSASALGCAAIYCAYSWWHAFRFPSKRLFWFISAGLFSAALVVSTQRTMLLYPLIVLLFAYAYRTQLRTFALYLVVLGLFITGVIFSDYLLDKGLDQINLAISKEGAWSEQVLKVGTYSDRLRGWQRLKRPESWSLIGTQREYFSDAVLGIDIHSGDYNHDVINQILINYGVVGILAILIPSMFTLRGLHRTAYQSKDLSDRNDAAFVLSMSLPMIFLSMIGGDNFNTNPINLQLWTAVAGVFVLRQANRLVNLPQPTTESLSPASPALTQLASTR